jgi:predicted Zn finger-like uncharacterized protein
MSKNHLGGMPMIVTCASCLTKFNLDESKIPAKGTKVRCSRCQHVFVVVPPEEKKEEEITENFESFIKQHEELIEPGQAERTIPSQPTVDKKEMVTEEEEEPFLFSEKAEAKKEPLVFPAEFGEAERAEVKPPKPKRMARREKRGPSMIFALIVILILLVFGVFYLWTELGTKGKLATFFEEPMKKVTALWDQILGVKQEGLTVGDLNRYDEKVGEVTLSVIEGKVNNQSQFARKHIKIKVVIFDQNKDKVTEKETLCGLNLGREGLKNLPPEFFKGEMLIQPQLAKEMIVLSGKDAPFMVLFKDLSSQAKEFKVEISDAPNL